MKTLLSVSADAKTVKGESKGFLTGILYLAPADVAGVGNFCANSTPGCRAGCLFSAGRAAIFPAIWEARIRKTREFKTDRVGFLFTLVADIRRLMKTAARKGLTPVVRLNGTSDLLWENILLSPGASIMTLFPTVQFYDYTKDARRMGRFLDGKLPSNYHLTFSRSECNDAAASAILARGGNVAIVFDTPKGQAFPSSWNGYPIVNGDASDLRFLDTGGTVVGLRAKGKAKVDDTGFVVRGRFPTTLVYRPGAPTLATA